MLAFLMRKIIVLLTLLLIPVLVFGAATVPTDVQMPGTQPEDALTEGLTESGCDGCHGGYDTSAEPLHNWYGSPMSHAGRDPLFLATMAIAEQDFDGSGDLCLRCHMPRGWINGRSTPTEGDSIIDEDATWGVGCLACHRMTNPDGSEHAGVQNSPFIAKTGEEGHYGSGQYVFNDDNTRLGPYTAADTFDEHPRMKSRFHRSSDMCGTCHDVSNPVVGNLAHNSGAQSTADAVIKDSQLGGTVNGKAAFNNPPYKYGVVERTYSEHKASAFESILVNDYLTALPEDLRAGAIERAYNLATQNGTASGNYEDGDARYFTCQTCHMSPKAGTRGAIDADKARNRSDNPVHDLTGGNYWLPQVIQYLDLNDKLLLGKGLDDATKAGMNDGILRAKSNLEHAANLQVNGNQLKVINLTGHKLISGYPEGRRMWINIKWYDANDSLIREDGTYGDLQVALDTQYPSLTVKTLLNPDDPNTKIYEAHSAITQEWAQQLLSVNADLYTNLPVAFDRTNASVVATLGDVANQQPGTYHESFHFVLNNKLVKDNRIPPYGMEYEEARKRNILPVPSDQYGNPTQDGTYNYWDEVTLNPPAQARTATVQLMYQPTSWEYIQFLYLANTGQETYLAEEGNKLLDAWLNTGMAEPHVMASATWTASDTPPDAVTDLSTDLVAETSAQLLWTAPADDSGSAASYDIRYSISNISNDTDFNNATQAEGEPTPAIAGTSESFTLSGLNAGETYYFALKASDGTGNTSELSNVISTALKCSAGNYSSTGYGPCTLCSVGTYQPNAGQTSCIDAPAGRYVSITGATVATTCPVGTYQDLIGQASCKPAPAGSYVSTTGAIAATACVAGTYQSLTGQSSCLDAPAGSYVSGTGSIAATACAVGYYQDETGQTSCKIAPAGSYVGVTGAASASLCAVGSYQPLTGQSSCLLAPAGSFVDSEGAIASAVCPVGSFTATEGNATCTLAPAGSYVSTTGAIAATACAAGTYQSLTGQSSCLDAPAGSYVADTGALAYTACAVGTYQDLTGQMSCKPAPLGYYVDTIGSVSATQCLIGSYSDQTGSFSCTLAPPGSYVASIGAIEATICPNGYFSSVAGSSSCDQCPSNTTSNETHTACVSDGDSDGVADSLDNCPNDSNSDQINTDGLSDGGDVCDTDDDEDGFSDQEEVEAGTDPLDPHDYPIRSKSWKAILPLILNQ